VKIQRKANGDVVLTLSGRLDRDSLSELIAVLATETAGRTIVLDLKDVVLVDRDTVRFLRARERAGTLLRNSPPYNVFNWPNFANPASDVSSPSTFGRISAMSVNPRIMQFALKLEF
jgi:hypothetical protein